MNSIFNKINYILFRNKLRVNISVSIIVYTINAIILLLYYPIYLKYLNLSLISLWSLLSIFISFAEMGNFGIGDAIVKYVAEYESDVNNLGILKIIGGGFTIIFISSFIIIFIGYMFPKEICNILKVPNNYLDLAISIIPYLSIIASLTLLLDLFKASLIGLQFINYASVIFLFSNIIKLILMLILFYFGLGIWSLIYSYILSLIMSIIIYFILLTNKINNFYKFIIYSFNKDIKKLLVFGKNCFGAQILNMFSAPLIKIILSYNNYFISITYFEMSTKIIYTISDILKKGLYALLPKYSYEKNYNNKYYYSNIISIIKKIFFIGLLGILIIILSSPFWIKLWIGKNYNIEIVYCICILTIGMLASLTVSPIYYFLMANGKEKYVFHEALLRVLLCIIFLIITQYIYHNKYMIYLSFSISAFLSNVYVYKKGIKFLNER